MARFSKIEGRTQYEPETPFLDRYEPEQAEEPTTMRDLASTVYRQMETPFVSYYEVGQGEETGYDPQRAFYAELLSELHDETFEDAIHELVQETAALYETRMTEEYGDPSAQRMAAERMARDYLAPLARDAEELVDRMAQGVGEHDIATMTEDELDTMMEQYEPQRADLSPAFENFLKGLWKKAKKAVKGVASAVKKGVTGAVKLAKKGVVLASKVALAPTMFVFNKLKKLIRPLIERVLKIAMGKIPAPLQPAARMLAKKYLGIDLGGGQDEPSTGEPSGDVSADSGTVVDEPTVPDPSDVQNEMDIQIANLLMEGESLEEETASAEYAQSAVADEDYVNDLSEARTRFVSKISALKDDESAEPAMEEFLPAILPVLKLGIKLIGRKKVVNFLAGLLAKLVAKLVGPNYAKPLSQVIVDVGMGLFGFELSPEQSKTAASRAVAATVEDTVRRVSALPSEVLENEELLEAAVYEAFEAAAAANLPTAMIRPELRSQNSGGVWLATPNATNAPYKKFSTIFERTITPVTMASVKTFGGAPLASVLRDQYGLDPRKDIKARVHLFEAVPGTWLSKISALERNVRGLGSNQAQAWMQIHPLTPSSAGAILGDPGLGSSVDSKYLHDRNLIGVGQRFYYLEIDGARAVTPTGQAVKPGVRRSSRANVTIDCPRNKVVVALYLSEEDAREVARQLKNPQKSPSAVLNQFSQILGTMQSNFSTGRNVRVIHETTAFEEYSLSDVGKLWGKAKAIGGKVVAAVKSRAGSILGRAGALVKKLPIGTLLKLAEKIAVWVKTRLLQYLKAKQSEFVTAIENPADGVTIVLTFSNPPYLDTICNVLKGIKAITGREMESSEIPSASVQILPGFHRR